jgi:hypothetical protein
VPERLAAKRKVGTAHHVDDFDEEMRNGKMSATIA